MKFANWRWWIGGGAMLAAGVVGCYSAVVVNEAGHEHLVRKIASDLGEPANGGKVRLPLSASFEGDSELKITSDTVAKITLVAEAELTQLQVQVTGVGELTDVRTEPLVRNKVEPGESIDIELMVPAKNGGLVVSAQALVNGDLMSSAIELKVVNPQQAKEQTLRTQGVNRAGEPMAGSAAGSKVGRDATGTLIESVPAGGR